MPRTHSRLMILGIVCAVPILLCLIGTGVLLYLVADGNSAEVGQLVQRRQTAAELQQQIQALRRRIEQLKQRLQEVDRRLADAQQAKILQSQIAQLQQEKQRLQQELEKLLKLWEELQKRLSANTQELEKLQRQAEEAQVELARLEQKIREMQPGPGDPKDPGPTIAELQAQHANISQKIESQKRQNEQAQARLDELAQAVKHPDKYIKLGEIRGSEHWQAPPNPLYVECDQQGILLQPENRRLPVQPDSSSKADFLQTARQRKYVLFLIRPNGFDSFRNYRKLLEQQASEVDYGYEPIRQDGRVLYPERS